MITWVQENVEPFIAPVVPLAKKTLLGKVFRSVFFCSIFTTKVDILSKNLRPYILRPGPSKSIFCVFYDSWNYPKTVHLCIKDRIFWVGGSLINLFKDRIYYALSTVYFKDRIFWLFWWLISLFKDRKYYALKTLYFGCFDDS